MPNKLWTYPRRLHDRVLLAICVAALPLVAFGWVAWNANQERVRANALEGLSGTAELARTNLDDFLTSSASLLELLAQTNAVQDRDWPQTTHLFRTVVVRDGLIQNIYAADADGTVRATTAWFAFDPTNVHDDPQLEQALGGSRAIALRLLSHATHDPAVSLLVPIRARESDRVIGVLAAEVSLASLQKRMAGPDVEKLLGLSLVDEQGTYLVHPDWERVLHADALTDPPVRQAIAGQKKGTLGYSNGRGEQRLVAFSRLDTAPWTVVLDYPAAAVSPGSEKLLVNSLAILLVVILLSFSIAVLVARSVTRPLHLLSGRAREIAAGRFGERLELGSLRELEGLGEAFNSMAESLSGRLAELERANAERHAYAEQLQRLLVRTVSVQEEERRRIALEVHDGATQIVSGALYHLRAIDDGRLLPVDRPFVQTARTLIEQGLQELRRLLFDLHPTMLEELGLEQAVRAHVLAATGTGASVRYRCSGAPYRLPARVELATFRICQEAVHNALHHAGTRRIGVFLRFGPTELEALVVDAGQGFDHASRPEAGHLGLLGMRERARAIRAQLIVRSRRGRGTLVRLRVPATRRTRKDGAER